MEGAGRPFALVVWFMATGAVRSPQTQEAIDAGAGELQHVSRTWLKHHPPGSPGAEDVFFATLDYADEGGMELFTFLQIASVPAGMVLRKDAAIAREGGGVGAGALSVGDDMLPPLPIAAEIKAFVEGRTGLDIGELFIPTYRDHPLFAPAAAAAAAAALYGVYQFLARGFLWWPPLYAAASLAVFFFASSGGMYVIIRKMPMYVGSGANAQYFLDGGQGQYGAEGYYMGAHYLGLTFCLGMLTYALPNLKDVIGRRLLSYTCCAAVVYFLAEIMQMVVWKNGYRLHFYLPEWLLRHKMWQHMKLPF
mmetsp:Transcript_27557/g.76997  ORF Transcript_27557/g.76997 Transcript_27557/m.76997 type:complete len:307 (+) Transcript_27557:1-921(+)